MANDRDCENCKHHKEVCKDGIFYHSCESWDCEFEPKEDEEFEAMEDAISRQKMLKYFEGWKNQIKYYHPYAKNFDIPYEEAVQWVKDLPPVNPQKPCKDCQYKEWLEGEDLPPVNPQEPCKDAISRQAVLNVVEKAVTKEVARWSIKELPPVNPQKPICPSAGVDCEDCPAYEKKSEWEHDHEILRAYSDGASAVLNQIRAEIDTARFVDKDTKHCRNANATGLEVALNIIDKYMAEEGKA